jgi:chromosome partitioning protein
VNSRLENTIRDKAKNTSIVLSKHLDTLKTQYDYIFLDCAPALNLTSTAAICSCDTVVLPINPDPFSQIGLKQTLDEIAAIQSEFQKVSIDCRILFNRFDQRDIDELFGNRR